MSAYSKRFMWMMVWQNQADTSINVLYDFKKSFSRNREDCVRIKDAGQLRRSAGSLLECVWLPQKLQYSCPLGCWDERYHRWVLATVSMRIPRLVSSCALACVNRIRAGFVMTYSSGIHQIGRRRTGWIDAVMMWTHRPLFRRGGAGSSGS